MYRITKEDGLWMVRSPTGRPIPHYTHQAALDTVAELHYLANVKEMHRRSHAPM